MIEFNINWYGTYNRHSAVADYLELLALSGVSLTKPDLADLIRDSGWLSLLEARIEDSDAAVRGPEPGEIDDTDLPETLGLASELADDVVNVLLERHDLLGDRYPFRLMESEAIVRLSAPESVHDPYLGLLALTICHADRTAGLTRPPAYIFEDVLTDILSSVGIRTACLGDLSRSGTGFDDTLTRACEMVGLSANPAAAPYRTFANEEGADTISNLWPFDTRTGGVQLIGQATCGNSNTWKAKTMEPPRGHWESWLGRFLPPFAFLSVPHHVQSSTRNYLVTVDRGRDVLDRIRLAVVDRELLHEERAALDLMVSSGSGLP